MIYHIASLEDWRNALASGTYSTCSLDSEEGFIHASFKDQVLWVANSLFAGQKGLVLLKIEQALLRAEVRLEAAPEGEHFPHIYGALNLDAVQAAWQFEPGPDGRFTWPDLGEEEGASC